MPYKVVKRGKNWSIFGSVNKVRRRKEFPGLSKAEVEAIASEWTHKAIRGKMPEQRTHAAITTFEDAAIGYLEDGKYLKGVEAAISYFGKWKLKKIKPKDVRKFATETYGDKIPSRNRLGIAPVRAVINWAANEGVCSPIRVAAWPEPKPDRKAAPVGWLDKFQEAARKMGPRYLGLAEMMEYQARVAARTDECVNIRWDAIQWDAHKVPLKTKNGEVYDFHIPADMVPALKALREQYIEVAEGDALWKGKPIHYKTRERMAHGRELVWPFPTKTVVWGLCKKVCAKAGIEYITPHQQGRHTFATTMHNEFGWSANDIAEAGHWKNVALVQKTYIHTEKTTRDASDLMAEKLGRKKLRAVK